MSSDGPAARTVALLACAGFASSVAQRICDPLLPELARSFQVTTAQAAQAITAFAIAYGLLQLFYGPAGDRYGKYRVVALASLGSAVGSLGCALANSLEWLIFFRALTGLTVAGIIPLSMAWIGDAVPYDRRQEVLARMLSGTIFGVIGGQLIGGVMADTLGWRWSFLLLAAMYLVVGVLLQVEAARLSLHADAVQADEVRERPGFMRQIGSVLQAAWARTLLAVVLMEAALVFGALAFIPTYLHGRYDVSLTAASVITALYGIGGMLYVLLARQFVRWMGEQGIALAGALALSAALVALALGGHWYLALPATFTAGLGYYMLHNTLQTNATQMVTSARGTAVALFAAAFFIGQSFGVAVAGLLVPLIGVPRLFIISAAGLAVTGACFSRLLRRRAARQAVVPAH